MTGIHYIVSVKPSGFLRDSDGTITAFDVPSALETSPASINDSGYITGSFADLRGVHGFIRIP